MNKRMMEQRNTAYEEFVGQVAFENDTGWTKDVWDAAWAAAREQTMLALEGHDNAIIGKCNCWAGNETVTRLVYSADTLIKNLVKKSKMSEEEALEWVEYNIEGAYMGPNTPIVVWRDDD